MNDSVRDVSPRVRNRTMLKYLDLLKLRVVTVAPSDLQRLRQLLTAYRADQAGRNPNFERFATGELDDADDLAQLKARYPMRHRITAWETARDRLSPTIRRIVQALLRS